MAGFVRTVTGDVDSADVGVTYCHEHLLARPPDRVLKQPDGADLLLDSPAAALSELRLFRRAGGRAYVDCTTAESGRDVAGLATLSRRAHVHVIAVTGYAERASWRADDVLDGRGVGAIADDMVRDLTEGIPGADGGRAGVIKAGTSLDEIHPAEARVLRAAAAAQRRTGAPITTHTTAGSMALEQARILNAAGADLSQTIVGHVDRRLVWEEHLALARTGCYLGYDCVSKEQYAPDSARVDMIKRLIAAGHGGQICLSGDLARRRYLTAYGGGPGLTYILWRFVPWLWQAGVSRDDTRRMLVDNPARALAWRS
jgi:phosphotriesterase-related protein